MKKNWLTGRVTGFDPIPRLAHIFALALALFIAPGAWADFTQTNPVTSEQETYKWKFTGTDAWNGSDYWEDSDGNHPSGVPAKTGSNQWEPLLVDGSKTISTLGSWTIEGWNLRMGFYNGANVSLGKLVKLQGETTMWITVDEKSHFAVAAYEDGNFSDNQTVKFFVANANGITWSDTFACSKTDNNTLEYYLKGAGSVSFQALNAGTHKIKMADVTLSGTTRVASKTLVSFTSTTKTFTADADIKVKNSSGDVLETLLLTSVTSGETTTLIDSEDVGTCELVQTPTGIVLYYVDGDPADIVAKTYKPSININFTDGNGLTTAADVGYGDYAVPGTSWNNLAINGTTASLSALNATGPSGATSATAASVAVSGTRGNYTCTDVTATTDLRNGYIDDADGVNASPQVAISGIPYYSYYAVVYFSARSSNVKFGYVTINGINYKWDSENSELVGCEGTSSDSWGASSPTAWTEGGNYIVTPTIVNSDGNFTIVSHRLSTSVRSGIAAIQIVEVPKVAGEGELVINVSGDTTYPVDANATYTTVYVTGVGTLSFSGEGTITTTTLNIGNGVTVPASSSQLTFTTVTGSGTVVYDGAQPSTTLGFDDSDNWFGTVWVKNVGEYNETKKSNTNLGGVTSGAASANPVNNWGNAYSFVKFTNVKGYMYAAAIPWTLILEDDGANYAWYNNNGWGSQTITIAGLKGDGTFYDEAPASGNVCNQPLNFTDGSAFLGTIYACGKRIGLGGATTAQNAANEFGQYGSICIPANGTATVSSGKTWSVFGGFIINGTLNDNGTLATLNSSAASIVSGSGTVVFTGRLPTPVDGSNETKWWKNANWTGTVQIANKSGMVGDCEFNKYGNANSTLELNNVTGWVQNNYECTVPLKITGKLTLNNGSSGGNGFTIDHLKGSGTIYGYSSADKVIIRVKEWADYTGAVQLTNKIVIFGEDTLPTAVANLTAGRIFISSGADVTIRSSGSWWAVNGIVVNGTLKAAGRGKWGDDTAMTLGDTGILELTSTANTEDYKDYSSVTGTGTIKYSSTAGWRLFPDTRAKMPATTLTIQTELADSLIIACTSDTVIGNLAGSKNIRSDWGDNSANGRTLTVTQSKDTEWSGKFVSNRITQFNVNPGASTTGTLTLSGTQTETVPAAINGSVNLTGTWKGDTTVSGTFGGTGTLTGNLTFNAGATFKAFATDADGLSVSGTVTCPAEGTVTLDVSDLKLTADVALLAASDLNKDKFTLTGAPENSTLEVVEDVLTLKLPVTITVPSVDNATATATIGDTPIELDANGQAAVPACSVVTVTYTANEGYELSGTAQYTIDTASATTFAITDTATVEYVASITVDDVTIRYTSLQKAISEATSGQSVTLLADVALTSTITIDKDLTLDLNGKNVTATNCRALYVSAGTINVTGSGTISTVVTEGTSFSASSSVIRVGGDTKAASFTLGENVTVSTDYCYGITYFGRAAQTVVIDGTVSVTGTQPALSGNGNSWNAEVALTVNGTVYAEHAYAIYNPQKGTTVINGTVTGVGGIEVKAGAVTVNKGATITANGKPSYTQSNQDGTSTVGYAIASVGNASYANNATVAITGGTIKGTTITIAENGATAGGVVTATSNSVTVPAGYKWVETATLGVYTLEAVVGTTFTVY